MTIALYMIAHHTLILCLHPYLGSILYYSKAPNYCTRITEHIGNAYRGLRVCVYLHFLEVGLIFFRCGEFHVSSFFRGTYISISRWPQLLQTSGSQLR